MAEKEATRTVTVVNFGGLHLRAATLLVNLAREFDAHISVTKGNHAVDPKSTPLQLLALGAAQGEELMLRAVGDDAIEAIEALAELVASHFGESPEDDPQQASQAPAADDKINDSDTRR